MKEARMIEVPNPIENFLDFGEMNLQADLDSYVNCEGLHERLQLVPLSLGNILTLNVFSKR